MGFFKQVESAINSVLPGLYREEGLVVTVTWKRFKDSVFNESQGVNEDTYTSFPNISVIRIEKNMIGMKGAGFPQGPWAVASGDIQYLFKFEDVPSGVTIRDLIVEGSITYNIKRIYPVFNFIVKVDVQGYA